jgi:glycolate oxidase FAD binding subunit
VDVSGLRGVVEYDPGEFTFTALAGTPLREVEMMLAERGQYLPFDPPFREQGATLGGTVAAGIAGSMQYRYGGVRDFVIGVRFVDGRGELVRGGGKVVKNAAGFDLPKLMVGSLGRLGILTEVTFKVFPAPPATATLRAEFGSLGAAVNALVSLTRSRFDLEALDLVPESPTADGAATLWVRIGGAADDLSRRLERISRFLRDQGDTETSTRTRPGVSAPATPLTGVPRSGTGPVSVERGHTESPPPPSLAGERVGEISVYIGSDGELAAGHWAEMAEMTWSPKDWFLYRIPVTPGRVLALDRECAAVGAVRRYSSGAQTAWVAWPGPTRDFETLLQTAGLGAVQVAGPPGGRPWIGTIPGRPFLERVVSALDPDQRFGLLELWP